MTSPQHFRPPEVPIPLNNEICAGRLSPKIQHGSGSIISKQPSTPFGQHSITTTHPFNPLIVVNN